MDEAISQIERDDPKQGYRGPIPIVSYDTNCINAKQRMSAMNELERLSEWWIDLRKSNVVTEELDNDKSRGRKACRTVNVGGEDLEASELVRLSGLRQLLFGDRNELTINDERDVRHLFDHQKYTPGFEWNFFVTMDHHVLDKKQQLKELGINVGTPDECLQWIGPVLLKLKERIRRWHARDKDHK